MKKAVALILIILTVISAPMLRMSAGADPSAPADDPTEAPTELIEPTEAPVETPTEPQSAPDHPVITKIENKPGGVKLTWAAYEDNTLYRVYYRKAASNDGTWQDRYGSAEWVRLDTVEGCSYLHTGVTDTELGCYTVRCVDKNGAFTSNHSPEGWENRYFAPLNIESIDNTSDGVSISWELPVFAETVRIYRLTILGWQLIGQTDGTEFTDTGAVSANTYSYMLRLYSPEEKRFLSGAAQGIENTFIAAPLITDVTNLTAGAQITWEPSVGAEQYRIYYFNGVGWTRLGQTSETSYTDTSVLNEQTRKYTVRCVDAQGAFISGYYADNCINTYYAPPAIQSISGSDEGVTLTWSRAIGAEDYAVYRRTESEDWTELGVTSASYYTDTTAEKDVEYTYTLRMISADGGHFMSDRLSGTKYTYRDALNKTQWLYALMDAVGPSPECDINDMNAVFELAVSRGIVASYNEDDHNAEVDRLFVAHTLVKAMGYPARKVGTVSDSEDSDLYTVAYYGYFLPDAEDKLYPTRAVTSDEFDGLLSELALYKKLKGKYLTVFGDSIMAGAGNVYDGGTSKEGMGSLIGRKYGMIFKNYAIGGAVMGVTEEKSHIPDQVRKAVSENRKADYIILNGGTNDTWHDDISLGTVKSGMDMSTAEESTFSGGFQKTMWLIRKQWGDIPVIYVRSHRMKLGSDATQKEYGSRALELASKWGAYGIDLYKTDVLNYNDRAAVIRYTFDNDTKYRGIHPNALGYATYYLPAIAKKLEEI